MLTNHYLGLSPLGFHRIVYYEYGPADGRLTVCVHGLTRNGRDFDRLAQTLAASGRRVICPDIVGRGQSDWLAKPELYTYPQYLADMAGLLARLGADEVDWIGTSMGGLMGMMLAAQPHTPIRKLVLNDVGPFIAKEALEKLAGYVGKTPRFETPQEVLAYLKVIHAQFGITEEADWNEMLAHSLRSLPEGGYGLAYDPAIGQAFTQTPLADLNLWALWDSIKIHVMVLRGINSDLLDEDTATDMIRRGPQAMLTEWPGCGHAPALIDPAQIKAIQDFLSF